MKLSDTIYEFIELWNNWMNEQKVAMSDTSPTLKVISISTCETLMSEKYLLMDTIDEYFKCLEKKN